MAPRGAVDPKSRTTRDAETRIDGPPFGPFVAGMLERRDATFETLALTSGWVVRRPAVVDSASPMPELAEDPATLEVRDEAPTAAPPVGDAPRVERLVREHHAFVWRTLRRQGLSDAGADDATQQVFLVLHTRIADVLPGREKSFLYRTALFIASDARKSIARSRSRFSEGVEPDQTAGSAIDPEHAASRTEARAILDDILDALTDERRAVFVLYELEGQTLPEIAALLDVPLGTATSRLLRAREDFESAVRRLRSKGGRR